MRDLFLVTYDIRDPKRLRQVFKTMRGFGDAVQYSVFRCELSEMQLARLRAALVPLIHHTKDQILIFRLGPVGGRLTEQVEALGVAYVPAEHDAIVV
jgi:CRISPR-associated protein Cas2